MSDQFSAPPLPEGFDPESFMPRSQVNRHPATALLYEAMSFAEAAWTSPEETELILRLGKVREAIHDVLDEKQALREAVLALAPHNRATWRSWDDRIEIVVDERAWRALDRMLTADPSDIEQETKP
jgi:hypothetical protein